MTFESLGDVLLHSEDPIPGIDELIAGSSVTRAVVGIDTYKYSEMEPRTQSLLPHAIDILLNNTLEQLRVQESAFFDDDSTRHIHESLIRTGDGFFAFVEDPLRAIIFSVYLQFNLAAFNSAKLAQPLARIVGPLSVRYALTLGTVTEYEGIYYGEPIILNARLMSLDSLNRFLFDADVLSWFQSVTNGIDTLGVMLLSDLSSVDGMNCRPEGDSMVFSPTRDEHRAYRFASLSEIKIGATRSKNTTADIYSLFAQVYMKGSQSLDPDPGEEVKFIVTLGNTNPTGLART